MTSVRIINQTKSDSSNGERMSNSSHGEADFEEGRPLEDEDEEKASPLNASDAHFAGDETFLNFGQGEPAVDESYALDERESGFVDVSVLGSISASNDGRNGDSARLCQAKSGNKSNRRQ